MMCKLGRNVGIREGALLATVSLTCQTSFSSDNKIATTDAPLMSNNFINGSIQLQIAFYFRQIFAQKSECGADLRARGGVNGERYGGGSA